MKVADLFESEDTKFMHRMLRRFLARHGFSKQLLPSTNDDFVGMFFDRAWGNSKFWTNEDMMATISYEPDSERPWCIIWHASSSSRVIEINRADSPQQVARMLQSWKAEE